MGVVELFMTDFCPFAQRAWLAFLEKEKDPRNPQLFNYVEVNYFNPDLPLTQRFLKLHNTVPAGYHDGEELRESMPIVYWVDEHYPQNPLQPSSAEGREHMKALIKKYTSGEFDITGPFYKLTFTDEDTPAEEVQKQRQALLRTYAELSRDLAASGGPYLLGQQFSVADIALIPFIDRAIVLLGHYKQFTVPQTPEYAAFHAWRKAYAARPSHQISDADRLPRSVAVQPFKETQRNKYLVEMYEGYANNVREEVRAQLRHAPPGVRTVDIAAAKAAKKAKIASEAAKLRQQRAIAGAAAIAFGAFVVAKLVQAYRRK